MRNLIRVGIVFALFLFPLVASADVSALDDLALIDAKAMSGEPEKIRASIDEYQKLEVQNPEVSWRLVRAYFNYYDELTDRSRRKEQQWAADSGYKLAEKALKAHPNHPEVVYYYATIGLCYLDFHRMQAIFLVNDLLKAFHEARELKPEVDDGGPDRSLGILYHELPGWPVGKGDDEKSLFHLKEAVRLAPKRGANRLTLAGKLADMGKYDEGWKHIEFMRSGAYEASSQHWRNIYTKRIEEVASEFPQAGR